VRVFCDPRTTDLLGGRAMDGEVVHSPHSGSTVDGGVHSSAEGAGCSQWGMIA